VPNHECSIPGANPSHSLNESSHGFNHTSSLSVSSRLPPPLPANETSIYTASYTSKPVIGTHQLFTKSSGLFFSNAISGFAKPTGTGPSIHLYGTGVSSKASRCVLIHDTRADQSQSLPRLDISHIQKSAGALLLNDSSGVAGPTGTAVLSTPLELEFPSATQESNGFGFSHLPLLGSHFCTSPIYQICRCDVHKHNFRSGSANGIRRLSPI
jgi:hypothetical protein